MLYAHLINIIIHQERFYNSPPCCSWLPARNRITDVTQGNVLSKSKAENVLLMIIQSSVTYGYLIMKLACCKMPYEILEKSSLDSSSFYSRNNAPLFPILRCGGEKERRRQALRKKWAQGATVGGAFAAGGKRRSKPTKQKPDTQTPAFGLIPEQFFCPSLPKRIFKGCYQVLFHYLNMHRSHLKTHVP